MEKYYYMSAGCSGQYIETQKIRKHLLETMFLCEIREGDFLCKTPFVIKPTPGHFDHIWYTLYTQLPLLYALLLAVWKGMLGVLTMTFGFALALYGKNIFVVLTAPFIYVILENFILSILSFPMYRFVTAFEPTSIVDQYINFGSFLVGPILMCLVIGLVILYFQKIKKCSVYTI